MRRNLTSAQHARLDDLAENHPEAKVIDWVGTENGGPIFEYRDGYRYINKWGRICGARKPTRDLRPEANFR